MFSKSALFALFASVSAVLAGSVADSKRDLFSPPITSPNSESVWVVAHTYNVTWDISNPPQELTGHTGKIVLSKGGVFVAGIGGYERPLATDFDILRGFQEVRVPDVEAGDDYTVVLFGDSGNDSQKFRIVAGF